MCAHIGGKKNYDLIYNHLEKGIMRIPLFDAAEAEEVELSPEERTRGLHGSIGKPISPEESAYMEAWRASWPRLALYLRSHELGSDEAMEVESDKDKDAEAVGNRTSSAFFQAHHHHRGYERDHVHHADHPQTNFAVSVDEGDGTGSTGRGIWYVGNFSL